MIYLTGPIGSPRARRKLTSDLDELYSPQMNSLDDQLDPQLRRTQRDRPLAEASPTPAGPAGQASHVPTCSFNNQDGNTLQRLYDSAFTGNFPVFQQLVTELSDLGIPIPFQQLATTCIHPEQVNDTILRYCLQNGASLDEFSTLQAVQSLEQPPQPILDVLNDYHWEGLHDPHRQRLQKAFREDPGDLVRLMDKGAIVSREFLQYEAQIALGFDAACIKVLLERLGVLHFETTGILQRAAAIGARDTVRLLLDAGADVNERIPASTSVPTRAPSTALLAAVECGEPDIVSLLLNSGARYGVMEASSAQNK
ncbi:putative ankyrin repeat-containing domain superfamily [Acrodontium crateriforme]|uniref:Ankyrin repeat-containing domain superfamily n=1 Tax=Acrodontium crateriforme TaxID=150365 RepID=A0AAQ3M0Y4_9PEZI|nr:putative ankyrin repeat-containing domain superfamily [Acrodontium crateriforme]